MKGKIGMQAQLFTFYLKSFKIDEVFWEFWLKKLISVHQFSISGQFLERNFDFQFLPKKRLPKMPFVHIKCWSILGIQQRMHNAFISAGVWVVTKQWWIKGMLRWADDPKRAHSGKRTKGAASCDQNERRATTCWLGTLPSTPSRIFHCNDQTWSDSRTSSIN